ncbi:hypothetical protein RB195_011235 [Necator americanus]|uniref:Secreted protein n=1 Tax=Necator americanus TaxID=51031 RepID=A0ABR1D2Q3_NECAM
MVPRVWLRTAAKGVVVVSGGVGGLGNWLGRTDLTHSQLWHKHHFRLFSTNKSHQEKRSSEDEPWTVAVEMSGKSRTFCSMLSAPHLAVGA